MRTIWKWRINYLEQTEATFEIPTASTIRHVDAQAGVVSFWAEVNSEDERDLRRFVVIGTGHEVPEDGIYQGTALADPLVLHLYEVPAS
jgi:hypothetical protein